MENTPAHSSKAREEERAGGDAGPAPSSVAAPAQADGGQHGEGGPDDAHQQLQAKKEEFKATLVEVNHHMHGVVQVPLKMMWVEARLVGLFACVGLGCGGGVVVLALLGEWAVSGALFALSALALGGAVALWLVARGLRRDQAFNKTKRMAKKLLEDIDEAIAQERQHLAQREEADMASVCALPSDHRPNLGQRLPRWWSRTAPVRLVLVVVGAIVFVMSDATLLVGGDPLGLLYSVVVQPWVRVLVKGWRGQSQRMSPHLDAALAALANDTEGVEFVAAPLKKSARALVKIRDDYLAPTLWHRYGLAGALLFPMWTRTFQRAAALPVVLAQIVQTLWVFVLVVAFALSFVSFPFVRPFVLLGCVGGQAARVVDMARGSLVCDSARHLLAVHERIMSGNLRGEGEGKAVEFEVVRFKNGWADENEKGYVQLLYNVRVKGDPTGVVAEVQVTHRDVYQWRQFTHKPYKVIRAENAAALVRDIKSKAEN